MESRSRKTAKGRHRGLLRCYTFSVYNSPRLEATIYGIECAFLHHHAAAVPYLLRKKELPFTQPLAHNQSVQSVALLFLRR